MMHAYDGDPPPQILVVDTQPAICFILQRILEHYGYSVVATTSQVEALRLVVREAFDLLLVEPRQLEEVAGREFIQLAQAQQPGAALALLIGADEDVTLGDSAELDYLVQIDKTASSPAIATGVAIALARRGWASDESASDAPQSADCPPAEHPQNVETRLLERER